MRFGTTVSALQAANGLTTITIYVGQVLLIPGGSVAPAPVATAAPPGAFTRPNGLPIHAAHRATPPQIDGDLGEWSLSNSISQVVYRPENWAGPADQGVTFAVGWDGTYLYLAASVVDDVHVQTQHGELIYKGDSLELLLDADLGGDYWYSNLSADDYQVGLSPGALTGDRPEAYLWYPASRAGLPGGVLLAARPNGGGYQLE
ncbi:MAG: LysM peptidoglycan-binding domain-containing protein, partial [Chloroflexi bacterium]|nr:LysM peptidoglycan-binding domain-containing protein [Chloroflexota bacterium]